MEAVKIFALSVVMDIRRINPGPDSTDITTVRASGDGRRLPS
jgi:hypothetical protein